MKNVGTKLLITVAAAGIIATEANAQEQYFTYKPKDVSTKSDLWDNSASNIIFPYNGIESHIALDMGGLRQITVPSPANGFMILGLEGNWSVVSNLPNGVQAITSIGLDSKLKFASENDVKRVLANGTVSVGEMFTFSNDRFRLFAGGSFPFSTLKDTSSAVLPMDPSAFVGAKLGPVFLTFDAEISNKGLQRFGGLIEVVPVYFLSFTGTVRTGVKDAYRLALGDVGAKIKVNKSGKYFIDIHAFGGLGRDQFHEGGRFVDKYLYGGSVGLERVDSYRISLGINGAYEPLKTEMNKNGVPSIGGFVKFRLVFPSLGQKKYKQHSDNGLYLPSEKDIFDKKAMLKDITAKMKAVDQGRLVQSKKSGLYVPAKLA